MLTRLRTLLPILLLLAACGGSDKPPGQATAFSASAPAPQADATRDVEELRRYRLNMDDMRKWVQVQKAMAQAERTNPKTESEEAEQEDGRAEPAGDAQTLDGIQARVESIPEFRNAVEAAGLKPRAYGLITLAYMQAGMATAMLRTGADRDSLATAMNVNPANIDFISANEAELARLMGEVEAEAEGQ
jgi:hypothetical protein